MSKKISQKDLEDALLERDMHRAVTKNMTEGDFVKTYILPAIVIVVTFCLAAGIVGKGATRA